MAAGIISKLQFNVLIQPNNHLLSDRIVHNKDPQFSQMESCNHVNTFTFGLTLLKNLLAKTTYSNDFKWGSVYPGLYKLCKSAILRGFPRTVELEQQQNTGINTLWSLMK